jgi:membrane-associated phospholipid phosphatase
VRIAPEDQQATLLIASGAFMTAAGLICWWFGTDIRLHYSMHLSAAAAPVVARLSALGGAAVMIPIALVGFLFLLAQKRRIDAAWLFLTIAIGRLGIEGLKLVLSRPRPPSADWLEHVNSWSFPSSHSAGTMMTCVALALLFGRGDGAILLALLAALFIGWTRIALGVHWPSDVMAGWGIGLVWMGLAMSVRNVLATDDATSHSPPPEAPQR